MVISALQHLAQTLSQKAAALKEMISGSRKFGIQGEWAHFKTCLDAPPLQVPGTGGRNRRWFSGTRAQHLERLLKSLLQALVSFSVKGGNDHTHPSSLMELLQESKVLSSQICEPLYESSL